MCSAELEAGHEVWHPRKRGEGGGETADGGSPDNSGYQDADAPRHSAHEVSKAQTDYYLLLPFLSRRQPGLGMKIRINERD